MLAQVGPLCQPRMTGGMITCRGKPKRLEEILFQRHFVRHKSQANDNETEGGLATGQLRYCEVFLFSVRLSLLKLFIEFADCMYRMLTL